MVELRDYQTALLRKVGVALDGDSRSSVMMQLPTGGGKTIIAGGLLKAHLADGRKAVWLTHRRELAEQTREMLTSANVSAMADVLWKPRTDAPAMSGGVVILMAQTVSRRVGRWIWSRYDGNDLMVIDEAHHAAAKGYAQAMRHWPGRVVGMTATPWRLSEKEGFDHLFGTLICGPQVSDLQSDNWLCRAEIRVPSSEDRIQGGEVGSLGDYTEPGIERANSNDVLTAGALKFWQDFAQDRQTIAYAVSKDHAHNLAAVFVDAGIPARVILGDTPIDERNRTIEEFRDGDLRVLVNVLVATEGFDLPDASCVVLTRPTLSLALFMQMVGRGLRPKHNSGDCLILDLAANSITHGLPNDDREWQLEPRGKQEPGEAPVVWCPRCGVVSPAASQNCPNCGYPFGKECARCGRWRAWRRWQHEHHCDNAHELVCDYCHRDAHIQAHLPITSPLDELPDRRDDNGTYHQNDFEIDDKLGERMSLLLRELLEQERGRVYADRHGDLQRSIEVRKRALEDEGVLDVMFAEYIEGLPEAQRPQSITQTARRYLEWERNLKDELDGWQTEIAELKEKPDDKRLIFDNTRDKVTRLLSRQAQDIGILSDASSSVIDHRFVASSSEWILLSSSIPSTLITGRKPSELRMPEGQQIPVAHWPDLLVEIIEWFIRHDKLTVDNIPISAKLYLVNNIPRHVNGTDFKAKRHLSNGHYLEASLSAKQICNSVDLLNKYSDTPVQFFLRLA